MNILVFSWRDPKHPLAGGAEQVMHEHMKGWIAAGHKVTLFSSRFSNSKNKETIDGVNIIRNGYQYLGVQLAGFFYYLKHRNKYDFVVDQFHGIPFFTPLYSRKPKLAVIQEPARKVWFLNPLPKPFNWIVGIIGYLGEPIVFLFYKNTIFMTGSASAKKDVNKFGIPSKNIHIILHGVIIKKLRPFPEKEKIPTIVFLGIHSKDKGIEDVIHCFNLLKKKKYQFWTIGKFETKKYERRIMNLVMKYGLNNKIKLWGYVSQKKKFELLARAHVLINPSVHEGWGLVNIEANAVGTPVIAYKSQGLIDSVVENQSGVFCKNNTPQAMAKEINNLLENKKQYRELSDGAIIWSNNFSWKKSKQKSLKLIQKLSQRPSKRK